MCIQTLGRVDVHDEKGREDWKETGKDNGREREKVEKKVATAGGIRTRETMDLQVMTNKNSRPRPYKMYI